MVKKRHTRHASHHYHRNHTRRAPQAVALLITITGRRQTAGKKKPAKWRAKKGGKSRPYGLK